MLLAASMLGAPIGPIILVASRMQPPRVVSTLVSPVHAAPTTSPPGDAIPALPDIHQEASSETLQPFVPPPGGDAGDIRDRP